MSYMHLLKVVIVLMLTGIAAADEARPTTNSADLVDFLIIQNEKARKAMMSISFDFEIVYESRDSEKPTSAKYTGHVIRSGELAAETHKRVSTYADGTTQSAEVRVVVGETAAAFWHVGNSIVYEYRHEAPAQMSDDEKHLLPRMRAPDMLRYGFGNGGRTLEEERSLFGARVHWRAETVSGGSGQTLFRLHEVARSEGQDSPIATFELDPSRGFLVTNFTSHGLKSNEIVANIRVEPTLVDDVWVPASVDQQHFRSSQAGTAQEVVYKVTGHIENIRLRPATPIGTYTLESLQLPRGRTLIRTASNGQVSVWHDGPQGFQVDERVVTKAADQITLGNVRDPFPEARRRRWVGILATVAVLTLLVLGGVLLKPVYAKVFKRGVG